MLRGSVRQWRRVGRGVDTHPGVVLLCWALKGFFFFFFLFFFSYGQYHGRLECCGKLETGLPKA